MKNLKGKFKGAAIILVLCLATYGAFVLFKRPPDLSVSEAERESLRDMGINITSTEAAGGRSAIFNNDKGVPPVGGRKSHGHGKQALPAMLVGSEPTSFAPTFDEAPLYSPSTDDTEAPPFMATVSPPQNPPASVVVPSAPVYGNQFLDAAPPWPSDDLPMTPPVLVPPLLPDPFSAPVPEFPPVSAVSSTPASDSVSTIPIHTGSYWDGPTANIAEPTATSTNPWGTTVTPESDGVSFVTPKIKPLPKVEEELLVQVTATAPIPKQPAPTPQPIVTAATFPEDYHRASIRRISTTPPNSAPIISFSPISPIPQDADLPKNEHALMFERPSKDTVSEPSPLSAHVVTPVSATVPGFVEPKTSSAVTTSFAVENPVSQEIVEARPVVSLPRLPKEVKSEVREEVVRSVKVQYELIQTDDPVKIRHAYIQLSKLYDHPNLNNFERAYLTPILDRLAVDVIFSRRNHILEAPYIVKVGEAAYTLRSGEMLVVPYGNSIDSIAAAFNLTPALLMKINGLTNKRPLEPGTELKVVLGQFDAKISTERREFTLILGGLYAGRFPIAVGENIQNVQGDFTVTLKGDTPQGRLLTLSNGITLRGVDRPQPGDSLRSAIRLTERDAGELYDILSERSVVAIGK